MTNNQKDIYRQILLEEKRKLIEELLDENESAEELMRDDSNDTIDYANTNFSQKLLSVLNESTKKKVLAIDEALKRIDKENYGICTKCSKEIGKKRLEVVPWATKCITCKTKEEELAKVR